MTGERATVHAAGRTDAGVHALAMSAHVDIAKADHRRTGCARRSTRWLRPAADRGARAARRSPTTGTRASRCIGRRYLYRILNRRAPLALERGTRLAHRRRRSTPRRCTGAAQALVGRHDFTTFRSAHCQSDSPVKTLDRLDVRREGDEIQIEAAARSFLHHQVRSMVGCLALVGRGQWRPDDIGKALEARDRAALGLQRAARRALLRRGDSIRTADYSAAMRLDIPAAARNFSASSAAMQPVPAAVTAWR